MDIFNYHKTTGEFLNQSQADPDPMQPGKYLMPAYSTKEQPPDPGQNQTAVFQNDAWHLVADYRGTDYWLANGEHHRITVLSETPPEGALFSEPPPPIAERRNDAKTLIDNAAGNARQRFVSTGTLIDMEYKLAQEQTKAWREAGSPAEDVPEAITGWAAAAGMTDEEAAADIEQTAQAWEQVLIAVRDIRLAGKAAVDAATDQGTADDMMNVAQPYIDQLDALKP